MTVEDLTSFAGWRAVGRRLVSIPLIVVFFLLVWATAPVWLLVAALLDGLRGGRFRHLRFGIHLAWALACEVYGIAWCMVFWLIGLVFPVSGARYRDWHLQLQSRWALMHYHGMRLIYGARIEVEEPEALGDGPMLLFLRHASLLDTLMPTVIIQRPHAIALRYIMKSELLWAPCLDLVGHRLPNCFVDRYSGDSTQQIDKVRLMTQDLGPREGILIYPEGTRPTPEKKARAMERLREVDPEFAQQVEGFENVLPPRPGGPLALLEENPGLDAVFCSHVGFEGAATIGQLVNGALIDRTIRVRFWRIPFAQIPSGAEARVQWLIENWRVVDRWVTSQGDGSESLPGSG